MPASVADCERRIRQIVEWLFTNPGPPSETLGALIALQDWFHERQLLIVEQRRLDMLDLTMATDADLDALSETHAAAMREKYENMLMAGKKMQEECSALQAMLDEKMPVIATALRRIDELYGTRAANAEKVN